MLEYITDHQKQLGGWVDQPDEPETFVVGIDLQGSDIRRLDTVQAITEEVVGDCCEDLGVCEANLAESENENDQLQNENDDLNNVLDEIIDDLIPSDAEGTIVSNQCTATLGGDTDEFDTGELKYARAGGAGNFIEAKSPQDMWEKHFGIDPAGGPNLGIQIQDCALRVVGNNGYVGAWQPNPNVLMSVAGLLQAGDTATVEGQWQKRDPSQTIDETPFTIFTFTATSPSSLVVTNDIGSSYNQDDRPA